MDDKITYKQALEALESLDDFAKMSVSVDASGAYATLRKFIENYTPAEPAGDEPVWVPCTPALLVQGVSCADTPRRDGDEHHSHDHALYTNSPVREVMMDERDIALQAGIKMMTDAYAAWGEEDKEMLAVIEQMKMSLKSAKAETDEENESLCEILVDNALNAQTPIEMKGIIETALYHPYGHARASIASVSTGDEVPTPD